MAWAQKKIDGSEHSAQTGRELLEKATGRPEQAFGVLAKIVSSGKSAQTKQHVGSNGISRWCCIIEEVLRTRNQRFMIAGREKESAIFDIPELTDDVVRQSLRALQPPLVECELI